MKAASAIADLKKIASPARAFELQRFFKTAPGDYGHGDVFLGIVVPQTRLLAKRYHELSLTELEKLANSPFHEARLCALIILTLQYKKTRVRSEKKKLFDFYMKLVKADCVNNWDLVDVTAPIIGDYLIESEDPYKFLMKLSKSKSLWERRVSIIFTFAFIRAGELDLTIVISEALMRDTHDLIHKATGWMLREMGKKDPTLLRAFLSDHAHEMPRTMLRYSIEKLPEKERKKWLLAKKDRI